MALCRRRRDACHLVKQRNTTCLSLQQSRPFGGGFVCTTNKATSCVFASKITATIFIRTVGKYCVICGVDNRPQAVRVRLLLLPKLHGGSTRQKPARLRRHCARKFVPFAKYAYVVAVKQGKTMRATPIRSADGKQAAGVLISVLTRGKILCII